MNKEEIYQNLNECISHLFSIARRCCTNAFSKNVSLIKRFVSLREQTSAHDFVKIRKKYLKKRQYIDIDDLVLDIYQSQDALAWIDLTLISSSDKETVIVVEEFECENDDEIRFHCAIMVPPRDINDNDKFDVNWWLK